MHSRSGGPERAGNNGRMRLAHGYLLAAALAYAAFVVYGSLVPLQFQAMPFDEALQRFRGLQWPDLGSGSSMGWAASMLWSAPLVLMSLGMLWRRYSVLRLLFTIVFVLIAAVAFSIRIGSPADWVTNILLYVPLAFLWLGVFWSRSAFPARLLASALVLTSLVAFSLAIEFCQLFYPPRVSSLNDVSAQIIGAALGIMAWWIWGERVAAWVTGWLDRHDQVGLPTRLLMLYLAGLFAYNVLPLDLTLSPVEIYHKFREGRLILIPFSGLSGGVEQVFYEIVSDIAIWIPVGLLWRFTGLSSSRAVLRTVGVALLLEVLQLLVYSRVSDITDVITALVGGWAGAKMAAGLPVVSRTPVDKASDGVSSISMVLAALAWCAVLLLVFWYPFDFNSDPTFLRERIERLHNPPFSAYYHSTEFRAVTSLLQKILFFVPLGLLLGRAVSALWQRAGPFWLVVSVLAAGFVGLVEAGRLMLPTKYPDTADWVITWLATLGGAWVVHRALHFPRIDWEHRRRDVQEVAIEQSILLRPKPGRLSPSTDIMAWNWRLALLGAGIATGVIWLATMTPTVPYNVRELLAPGEPLLCAVTLASALLLIGAHAGIAELSMRGAAPIAALWRWPLLLAGCALLCAGLLMQAVTAESVADVVGSPVLGWPLRLEQWLRLAVLLALVMWMLLGGMLIGRRGSGCGARRAGWLLVSVWLLPFCYWVIVTQAATDNLTELLAWNASPLAAGAAALTLLVAGIAGMVVEESRQRHGLKGWGVTLVVFPIALGIAWWLATLASEAVIVKYGRVFSGLQFLLGMDREHPPGPGELFLRFSIAYGVLLVFATWAAALVPRRRSGLCMAPYS